ncbi:biotin-dependent carboxyltransferase family protein [Salinimicrobium tongyeongense]|uniref:Biotin-dependent carboxyltransferase family protein n=1 Tax=Salinimicrobium tongyeongense TaxID=2809707 RepID=A0ABY6NRR5_9FLAO|nr:biotin-dependent carboxyltransferase family protein [Salinimicrobium tongyeongense]UZH55605.1 biotin-dependent carboxyltransferase family protein [Salinimicrobium tongyeongense]
MMAQVEIIQPGLYSSIQDLGRYGYRGFGVPTSGAMDRQAAKLANLLLKNEPEAALLEITLQGPKMAFFGAAKIAITGARLSPELDGVELENNQVVNVLPGQVLGFGKRKSGYRAYLAIKGGFQTGKVLGSRSWYAGVTPNSRLEKGMKLPFLETEPESVSRFSSVKVDEHIASVVVEALPGPEFELLQPSEKEALQKWRFSAAKESNRMGIQFQEKLENKLEAILTGPVLPGTVQLTPSGTLIALMRDGQTTGGYPRILQLTETGINTLVQKLPGEKFGIKLLEYSQFKK